MSKPERRPAKQDAFCRSCDKVIKKGEEMVSMYSWRNRGQNIYICLECSTTIGELVKPKKDE